jgi:hypothetical protein
MEIVLVFLLIVSVVLAYISLNLYKKYNTLEADYAELEKIADENKQFLVSLRNKVLSQQSYLRQLDNNGVFESDDEVGYFFKELKTVVQNIAAYVDIEIEESDVNQSPNTILGPIRNNSGE